jgi:hypothetical protein
METDRLGLQPRRTPGAEVYTVNGESWRFVIPAGTGGVYRLAQLDDYTSLPRRRLPWNPPLHLHLRARASDQEIPGTWGFGLWNDPFSLSFGLGGVSRRLPALPNAAWFFYASPPNYLSFRDDLPAQGLMAATFAASTLPTWLLAPGALGLPLALIPWIGRAARSAARRFVHQSAAQLELDLTEWHTYRLSWVRSAVRFYVDSELASTTSVSPTGPLGLVLWIDNQYAAWTPDGRLCYGLLPNVEPAWLEIADFWVEAQTPEEDDGRIELK